MRIKFIQWLMPPDQWKLPLIILLGILSGLGLFIFHIAKVPTYLVDSPTTCVNCHVMTPYYAGWSHSSHREVADCADCHMPQDNIFNHYYFKGKAGMRHAYVFTFRLEPQVITPHQDSKDVVYDNCVRCHTRQIHDSKLMSMKPDFHPNIDDRYCVDCHRDVPHGKVNSLTSVPDAWVPLPDSPVPEWLRSLTK